MQITQNNKLSDVPLTFAFVKHATVTDGLGREKWKRKDLQIRQINKKFKMICSNVSR